mmetsp:Transcript_24726/g.62157  ORF Transcript_24726/g.62157 Transcript_24726/m.62157 type:complete len:215 (+) Transcript_24726:353-997(+)
MERPLVGGRSRGLEVPRYSTSGMHDDAAREYGKLSRPTSARHAGASTKGVARIARREFRPAGRLPWREAEAGPKCKCKCRCKIMPRYIAFGARALLLRAAFGRVLLPVQQSPRRRRQLARAVHVSRAHWHPAPRCTGLPQSRPVLLSYGVTDRTRRKCFLDGENRHDHAALAPRLPVQPNLHARLRVPAPPDFRRHYATEPHNRFRRTARLHKQ